MNTYQLFGDIVQDAASRWYESDVTPALVVDWLNAQSGDVEIAINSLGGSVTAGTAIANAIRAYSSTGKGKVTANVLGIAASMASVVACACDELTMAPGSFLMIHNPWTIAEGDADELRHEADTLDKLKASLVATYASKFDLAEDEIAAYMDAETWIAAEDAETYHLRVHVAEETAAAAASATHLRFGKTPDGARRFFALRDREINAPEEQKTDEPDWEARYKGACRRLAALQGEHAAALAKLEDEHRAAVEDLNSQLARSREDLEKAKADLSSFSARAEKAERELADKGEQLERLTKAHALLTGGVLSPADDDAAAEYESALRAARSPEQREQIRASRGRARKSTK